jgi:hypothetical protein
MELVPYQMDYKTFWERLVASLDQCAAVGSKPGELRRLLRSFVCNAQPKSLENRFQVVEQVVAILNFVMSSTGEGDNLEQITMRSSDISAHHQLVSRLITVLDASSEGAILEGMNDLWGDLLKMEVAWRGEEAESVAAMHRMTEKTRSICEHGNWSAAARRCLAAAEHRCTNSVAEVADACAIAMSSTRELQEFLGTKSV